jgi:hypothetical protein
MTGKKPLILALVLFNAALLGVLVVLNGTAAQAQVIPSAVGRFAAVTQTIDQQRSLFWVVDTLSRRAIVYFFDRQDNRLRDVDKMDLQRVFRYREEAGQPERGTRPPGT